MDHRWHHHPRLQSSTTTTAGSSDSFESSLGGIVSLVLVGACAGAALTLRVAADHYRTSNEEDPMENDCSRDATAAAPGDDHRSLEGRNDPERNHRHPDESASEEEDSCGAFCDDPEARRERLPRLVILVRHGESEGNVDESVWWEKPDHRIELTSKGKQQACEAGKRIEEIFRAYETDETENETDNGTIDASSAKEFTPSSPTTKNRRNRRRIRNVHLHVSPFTRTMQTAREARKGFEHRIRAYKLLPRLREQEFGNTQDADFVEYRREQKRVGRFWYRFPTGESGADVLDRVKSWWMTDFLPTNEGSDLLVGQKTTNQQTANEKGDDQLHNNSSSNSKTETAGDDSEEEDEEDLCDAVVVFSHGLTIRLIMCQLFQWSIPTFHSVYNARNCDLYVLKKDWRQRRGISPYVLDGNRGDVPRSSIDLRVTVRKPKASFEAPSKAIAGESDEKKGARNSHSSSSSSNSNSNTSNSNSNNLQVTAKERRIEKIYKVKDYLSQSPSRNSSTPPPSTAYQFEKSRSFESPSKKFRDRFIPRSKTPKSAGNSVVSSISDASALEAPSTPPRHHYQQQQQQHNHMDEIKTKLVEQYPEDFGNGGTEDIESISFVPFSYVGVKDNIPQSSIKVRVAFRESQASSDEGASTKTPETVESEPEKHLKDPTPPPPDADETEERIYKLRDYLSIPAPRMKHTDEIKAKLVEQYPEDFQNGETIESISFVPFTEYSQPPPASKATNGSSHIHGGEAREATANDSPSRSIHTSDSIVSSEVVEETSTASTKDVAEIRGEVLKLLETYDSTKADRVDLLMEKFQGKEDILLRKLIKRYKAAATHPQTPATTRGRSQEPRERPEDAQDESSAETFASNSRKELTPREKKAKSHRKRAELKKRISDLSSRSKSREKISSRSKSREKISSRSKSREKLGITIDISKKSDASPGLDSN